MTVAPTGAGKGRSVLIPNLLTYTGPVITLDPKGELYHVTAARRRELGQRVIRLDPFRITGTDTDALNPLDVLTLPQCDLESESHWLASLLANGQRGSREPFWDESAIALLAGIITYLGTENSENRHLNQLRRMLHADDTVYNLAVLLDTAGKSMNVVAKQEIAAVLQTPDVTRGGILSTAISFLKVFASRQVADSLGASSFDLQDVIEGTPLTIYLIIPPDKLDSHRALLKLWIGTLLKAIVGRVHRPQLPTLFLIDECARLGNFPLLETAICLCRGYGLRVWTFWQDLQQIVDCFPTGWKTLVNNSAALQVFGITNWAMANQWGEFLRQSPRELSRLSQRDQILAVHGNGEQMSRRFDYLSDSLFQGLYQTNPLFVTSPQLSPPILQETTPHGR